MSNLLFDADDTLWENNIYYEQAIHKFIAFLNHSRLTHEEVRAKVDEIERRGGYGTIVFTGNLVEAYQALAEKEILEADLAQVRQMGEAIRSHPLQLMDGVVETLEYLSPRHELYLLTKGDPQEQQLKVDKSGIQAYFREVFIVPEKNAAAYQNILAIKALDAERTWMIGNSPRSDINPALAAGINAVFIPHPHTWTLEHEEVVPAGKGKLLTLASIAELRQHF
jgi:putative hydrolase of the HAD superfamily